MHKTLLKKINSKNLSVGIFGLGYVGLPLALRFAEKNLRFMDMMSMLIR